METTVAKIENLRKSFENNHVLKGVSLELVKGENLVIFGKSGSGKSVLIKCLVGLLEPDEGTIILFGENIGGLRESGLNLLRKRVGFLFQSAALYDSMSVRENLEFPLRDLKSKPKEEIEALVIEALQNVGLERAINKMPSELSGGMRKRVGLARTLILKPEIILYDEPTTGLDPITSKEISQLILDVQSKYNTASIIITHDVECARITANKMKILKDGAFIAEGTFQELSTSKDEWVGSFFQ
ncbi:MAG TPA: ATP-binding cassette domain-containing protein [Bacteroidia bacterium]|nr:ATP-binding cassette domain-containing protein [Bacteroidia bacterium]